MIKTIFFTVVMTGFFSTSLYQTADFVIKKQEVMSKVKSYLMHGVDGQSKATKTKKI